MMTIPINPLSCHFRLLRRYRERLPTLAKTQGESEVFYQLGVKGKQLKVTPLPSLPRFRNNPWFCS